MAGGVQMVPTGGVIKPTVVPNGLGLLAGQQPPAPIPNTLSPGEATSIQNLPQIDPVTGKPTGANVPTTGAGVAIQAGMPGLVPPNAFPNGGRLQPSAGPAPAAAPGQAPPAAPAAPARPPGSLGVTLAPGDAGAMEVAKTAAAKSGSALFAAADAVPAQRALIDQMGADLSRIRSTGPGTEREKIVNAFTQKYGGFGLTMTPDELAGAEGFKKATQQIAMAQAGALGVGTDEKLLTALGANPNLDLSKRGNAELVAMLKGNSDAIKIKAEAWQKARASGVPDSAYNDWQTQFNSTFDPRVFQFRYLPDDKSKISFITSAGDGNAQRELANKIRAANGQPLR